MLIGIGAIFLSASIRDNSNIGYYIFFIVIAIAFSLSFGYFKNAPIFKLSNKGLLHKNTFYSWEELSLVKLTGKGDMIFTSGECAALTFKDTTKIQIFDDFYSNISEIKCLIQDVVIDKKEEIEIKEQEINPIGIDRELFVTYKGNPIFSFRGVLMWGFIVFINMIPIFSNKPINTNSFLLFMPLCLFWFIINSCMLHFFEISKKYFVVKNHYFFWKKDIYAIQNIKEIVFESQPKQANKIRIITKNFKTKFYLAGSLTDKTWLEMKKELENKNIIVRNESII
ncbi:hypothetical protein [Flavobacterium sp.]|uniref:hypothetical protein n=1 Tax=Flavobacterium sp. TaxID=239 RepID=UPI00286DD401|nr:hypothetical protein [Flavobacterium sp.]